MQLGGVGGELEADLHPAPPGHVLRRAVRLEPALVQPAAHQVPGRAQHLRSQVGGHPAAGVLDVGRRPVQQVGQARLPGPRGQHRVLGDRAHPVAAQRRRLQFRHPVRVRVQGHLGAPAEQLAHPRRQPGPVLGHRSSVHQSSRILRLIALAHRGLHHASSMGCRTSGPRTERRMTTPHTPVEDLDVLVVGAGISGIGAGRYLRTELPEKTFAILEARATSGGTWDLFRYPGIRSDSDLHTFGYEFKPWRDEQAIADAPKILAYLRETATENGLDAVIRYSHRGGSAAWSSVEARWRVEVERTDTGERLQLTAGWLFCAGGYYRYDEGYTPHFEGRERFRGTVMHPQHWPADLDTTGKRVVVIGSGATAVT